MKYSIIMPYHNRAGHLHSTLMSFRHHYKNRDDWEVIVVEDPKCVKNEAEHNKLVKVLSGFEDLPGICTTRELKVCHNPAPLYNRGVEVSSGKFLVITNPECFHPMDILSGLDKEFEKNEDAYVVCSCRNVKARELFIKKYDDFMAKPLNWYQHTVHKPAYLHFCSSISRKMYDESGGFDDIFGEGYACEDVDFVVKIKRHGIPIIGNDSLMVYHLEHESCGKYQSKLHLRNKQILLDRYGTNVVYKLLKD